MPQDQRQTVFLSGATGFVGRNLYPVLEQAGHTIRCGARSAARQAERDPAKEWVDFDLDRPETLEPALRGCNSAFFLVHRMSERSAYDESERRDAESFAEAAKAAGVGRIIYLGGQQPERNASRHLRSRSMCGKTLRASGVPTVELRAAMVIGAHSESWRIVRDLCVRLPVMVLPAWLQSRSQPIDIEDVCFALTRCLELDDDQVGVYDLPGPEVLSAAEILARTSSICGMRPWTVRIPIVTPRLSSYWIQLVTRARPLLARELVEGLLEDLVSPDRGFWELYPDRQLRSFDDAARKALQEEQSSLPSGVRSTERWIGRLTPGVFKLPRRDGPGRSG